MDTSTALDRARSALAELPVELSALGDEELCAITAQLEAVGRLIDSRRTMAAAEVAERSRFERGTGGLAYRHGHARADRFLEQLTRVSAAEAARRIRLGEALRARSGLTGEMLPPRHPHLATAVAAGEVGVDAAAVIARALGQASAAASTHLLDRAEGALVDEARRISCDLVAVQARVWREVLDPDGAVPREEELRARRGFRLGRERNGMTPFFGAADPLTASILRSVLAERGGSERGPRFLADDEVAVEGDDPRTTEQRDLDILVGTLVAGMRSGERDAAPVATVLAVIRADDLQNGTGVGWLDGAAEPVTVETIRELVCDNGLHTVLLGAGGDVLRLGRTVRSFTRAQRRALAARDGGCVWPGCTAPAQRCHAHHVAFWEHGGRTDVENGVLLCPAHHRMLHSSDYRLEMIDRRPHLLPPPWIDPHRRWMPLGRSRLRDTG